MKKGTQLNDLLTMYNLAAVFFYCFINSLRFVRRRPEYEFGFPTVNVPVDLDDVFRRIDELVTDQRREEQMSPPLINMEDLNVAEKMWDNEDEVDASTDDDLLITGEDDDDEENMSEVLSPDNINFDDYL